MKFSNLSKIIFDLIMLVLLVAVYCAQPTGIPAHEYIGFAIYVFFIIHLLYNYKWVINVGKRFFDKTLTTRAKLNYAVDFLLLVSFVVIGISGIMISRVIFSIRIMPLWRQLHTIISAVSIVLLAFHIGLHGNMIINTVKTRIKLPYTVIKAMFLVVFIVILLAGLYGEIITRSAENQRPRYSTVSALFERSISFTKSLFNPPQGARPSRPERGGRGAHGQQSQFDINRLLISMANYTAYILLGSIMIYAIDNRRGKHRHKEKQHRAVQNTP
jgi:hypothetical protein